jgi:hypothetical protein
LSYGSAYPSIRLSYHENIQSRQPLGGEIRENFKAQVGGASYENKSGIHGYVSVSFIALG